MEPEIDKKGKSTEKSLKLTSNLNGHTEEVIGYLLPNLSSSNDVFQQHSSDEDVLATDATSRNVSVNVITTTLLHQDSLQLEEGPDTYIENITDELDGLGQNVAVQLEDGTTTFIRATHKDGIQAVHLQDGTTAYISHALDLEEFASGVLDSVNSVEINSISLAKAQTSSSTVRGGPPRISKSVNLGEKAFRCTYEGCNRLYSTQHHLKVHEKTHTGERPFKCNSCKKAFATGYSLKSHTRVHTGEKPYKCIEYCGKAFKTSGDLQKHLRTHTGERPFKCPYHGCDRAFTTSNIRKVHMRIHTGERPYLCPVESCDKTFASATNFKNHIRIHTGEKPYVCVVKGCGKKFTEYSSLYKHNVVHTPAKPYGCDICGRNYRQTSTLSMHRRSAHGITETGENVAEDSQEIGEQSESEDNPSQEEECQRIQVMVVDSNGEAQAIAASKNENEHLLEPHVQLQVNLKRAF